MRFNNSSNPSFRNMLCQSNNGHEFQYQMFCQCYDSNVLNKLLGWLGPRELSGFAWQVLCDCYGKALLYTLLGWFSIKDAQARHGICINGHFV